MLQSKIRDKINKQMGTTYKIMHQKKHSKFQTIQQNQDENNFLQQQDITMDELQSH